jgi:molybdopterin converting factor small subunit
LTLTRPGRAQCAGAAPARIRADTVREALRALEHAQPELRGWILDERGLVRAHINVFVDGEMSREETVLDGVGVIDVLPAISGGSG